MKDRLFEPQLPFIWPEPRILAGELETAQPSPLFSVLRSARRLFGILSGLDGRGIDLLECLLSGSEDLRCKLIVALSPGCATGRCELECLLGLQLTYHPRVHFRLLPTTAGSGAISNSLCIGTPDEGRILAIGPTPNLGLAQFQGAVGNLVFRCDCLVLDAYRKWFDLTWSETVPLTGSTTEIPHLVPAGGSEEAAWLWSRFEEVRQRAGASESESQPEVEEGAEGDLLVGGHGRAEPSPASDADAPALDWVAMRVARIYQRGQLVTIDKQSRVSPLDIPIKAEWFGEKTLQKKGSITRELKYRISVFDDRTLRDLENMRKKPRDLLARLSFPLADGVPWIPQKAQKLLAQEMDRVNGEAKSMLQGAVGGSPEQFVNARRAQIARDANDMYREFGGAGPLSGDAISQITQALTERLKKATADRFLPTLGYADVGFSAGGASPWVSQWGQALSLLQAAAEFPRKAMSDPRFFWGLHVDQDQLLDAMNVAEDHFLRREEGCYHGDRVRAELGLLECIKGAEVSQRAKCAAILKLIEGAADDEVWRTLMARDKTGAAAEGDA